MTQLEEGENQQHATVISAEEVAVYDRQIRLWGLEAQNRMRNSKILVINLGALANEVVKNIVLAGIGSLTILDSHSVTPQDLGAQFFIEDTDIGKNRATAAQHRIQKLNPRVHVTVDENSQVSIQSSVTPQWLENFDIIVATELCYDDLVHINNAARVAERKFYAGGLIGFYGYVFTDLVEHVFKIEREKPNVSTKMGAETHKRSIMDSFVKKEGHRFIETVTKVEKYKKLEGIWHDEERSFAGQFKPRNLAKMSPIFPALLALWDYNHDNSKDQQVLLSQLDLFYDSAKTKCNQLGIPWGIVSDQFLQSFITNSHSELAPVSAVVGGVLAQDILNVLAQKEQPIQNFFIFNGESSEGIIYNL